MNSLIKKTVEKEVVRLVSRAMVAIRNVYYNNSGYLKLQDFFFALPFQLNVIFLNEEKMAEIEKRDTYPSVMKYLSGYAVAATGDAGVKYLKIVINVYVPDNLKTVDEAIGWVEDNLIFNKDLAGEYALLFVYLHEAMHILHKHVLPSVNAKFDAIVDRHIKTSKVSQEFKDKIKNFAADFFINSMLMETARENSQFGKLLSNITSDKDFEFLYHPDLSANKGHTVETIIVELLKEMEVEDISISIGGGQGQDSQGQSQGDQSQDGQGQGDQGQDGQDQSQDSQDQGQDQGDQGQDEQGQSQGDQSQDGRDQSQGGQGQDGQGQDGQGQDGQGQDGQGQDGQGQGSQQTVTIGKTYKIKYKNFNYTFHDLNTGGACQNYGSGDDIDEVSRAVREAINQIANKFRGSGSAEIASQLGIPLEVTVNWLEKLESDLFKEVRYRTNKVSISWRKLKNKYRHIAKLPSTVHYDNVLNVIIVIDQSGSMSNLELRKINYIISKLAKRVKTCRVIIHDYNIVYDKIFKRNVDKELENEILKKRYATGGTSHKDVFDAIEKDFEDNSKEDFLVLIFSDMESDIENIWHNYNWTSHFKTYLVSTYKQGIEYVRNLPATKIVMDTGEML